MLFTWDTKDLCVVFRWWHVRGPWSLLFTLLGVVALGMSYEFLRHLARKYDECTLGAIRIDSPPLEPTDSDRVHPPPTSSPARFRPFVVVVRGADRVRLARRRHIVRAIMYGIQVFYSYLLMLVAMTYQGHVLIAIGIGAALGFYFFHDDKTPASKQMACH